MVSGIGNELAPSVYLLCVPEGKECCSVVDSVHNKLAEISHWSEPHLCLCASSPSAMGDVIVVSIFPLQYMFVNEQLA